MWENHTWHGHAEALDAFEPLLLFALWVLALVPVCFGVCEHVKRVGCCAGAALVARTTTLSACLTYKPHQPTHFDPINKRTYLASVCTRASMRECVRECVRDCVRECVSLSVVLTVPKKGGHLRRL